MLNLDTEATRSSAMHTRCQKGSLAEIKKLDLEGKAVRREKSNKEREQQQVLIKTSWE